MSRHPVEVADATPDKALEYENITLYLDLRIFRQVFLVEFVALFESNIDRLSVVSLLQPEFVDRLVLDRLVVVSPVKAVPYTHLTLPPQG